jgi:hypothetical protein
MENLENKYYDILFDIKQKIYVPIERKYMLDPNNINNHIIHTVNGLRTINLDIEQWDILGYIGVGLTDYQMANAKEGYNAMGFVVFEYKKYCQEFCDWLNEYMKKRR